MTSLYIIIGSSSIDKITEKIIEFINSLVQFLKIKKLFSSKLHDELKSVVDRVGIRQTSRFVIYLSRFKFLAGRRNVYVTIPNLFFFSSVLIPAF
jgi:hypothetical protein